MLLVKLFLVVGSIPDHNKIHTAFLLSNRKDHSDRYLIPVVQGIQSVRVKYPEQERQQCINQSRDKLTVIVPVSSLMKFFRSLNIKCNLPHIQFSLIVPASGSMNCSCIRLYEISLHKFLQTILSVSFKINFPVSG